MTFTVSAADLTAQRLSTATAAIRKALASFGAGSGTRGVVEDISRAFSEVVRVSSARSSVPQALTAETKQALEEYHSALAEWLRQLPRVQGWLLAERARLELRQRHSGSVRTWLDAQEQTR